MIRLHSLLLENRNASMRNTGGWQLNTTASDISLGFPVTRSSEIRTETIPVMNYRNGLNLGHVIYSCNLMEGQVFVSCEESSLHKSNIWKKLITKKAFTEGFFPCTLNAPDAVFPRLVSLFLTLVYSRSVLCNYLVSEWTWRCDSRLKAVYLRLEVIHCCSVIIHSWIWTFCFYYSQWVSNMLCNFSFFPAQDCTVYDMEEKVLDVVSIFFAFALLFYTNKVICFIFFTCVNGDNKLVLCFSDSQAWG